MSETEPLDAEVPATPDELLELFEVLEWQKALDESEGDSDGSN